MHNAAKTEKNRVIEIMERTGTVTFVVRVMPRASHHAIEGGHGGAMK